MALKRKETTLSGCKRQTQTCQYLWTKNRDQFQITNPTHFLQVQITTYSSSMCLIAVLTQENGHSQTGVWVQRTHLRKPAIVIDGVSLSHPQHWTLDVDKHRKTITTSKRFHQFFNQPVQQSTKSD